MNVDPKSWFSGMHSVEFLSHMALIFSVVQIVWQPVNAAQCWSLPRSVWLKGAD
jgi:hypothetical protein